MESHLLTAPEVAQLLRVNVETVYRLVQREGLPAAKIGGLWRFREADVRAWIDTRMTLSNPTTT